MALAACSGGEATTDQRSTDETGTDETGGGATLRDDADFAPVDEAIVEFVAKKGLNGAGLVVVDRDEGIVHEFYDGDISRDRISLIASASKMLTAGVLMRLHDQGLLDIDAPLADVVDWGAANPTVTAAQLLSNSSGLVGLSPNPSYLPYLCQYIHAGTLSECGTTIFTTIEDDDAVVPPDTEFRYGGGQWQVAGALAEAVSGRSWDELVTETYIEPCGLEQMGYNNHYTQITSEEGPFRYPEQFAGDPTTLEPTENPNLEGGVWITPPDYAQLLLMHLRGGDCPHGRVLSEESVDRLHTERVVSTYDGELNRQALGSSDASAIAGYAMGWWVGKNPDYLEDAGAFGAVPWLDLGRGYGAYLVIEETASTGRQLASIIQPLLENEIDELARG